MHKNVDTKTQSLTIHHSLLLAFAPLRLCVLIIFFHIICVFASPVSAADIDHPLSVGELVDIALQNNPATRQSWWSANRAAAAVESAKSAYYPRLDLEMAAQHGRDFKFLNGPDTNYTILGANLLLSMMLYDFGETSAGVKSAKMALEAANWETDWTMQKVMVEVLENAYATLHALQVVEAATISLQDAERMWHLAVELNRSGLSPVSDVYSAKVSYAQMKMDLEEQRAMLAIQRGKLAASLGLAPDADIKLAPIASGEGMQLKNRNELMTLATRQRADLMAKRAALQEALANAEKVRTSYYPKLSLLGRGGGNHALHDKTNDAQYNVTVGLKVPLFMGFESMYQKRMALADVQLSREELAQLETDIALEVLTYSLNLEAAEAMLPEADELLKNARQAYEGMFEIYRSGKERINAVSDAQRQLAAARVKWSEVYTNRLVSMAKLAYALGVLAPVCKN